jgi:hypothetical protein
MSLPSRAATYRYFRQVQVRSGGSGQCGYIRGCTGYCDNGHLTVLLRRRDDPRPRRPFPLVSADPLTIEVSDPQDYEGFVVAPLAA